MGSRRRPDEKFVCPQCGTEFDRNGRDRANCPACEAECTEDNCE